MGTPGMMRKRLLALLLLMTVPAAADVPPALRAIELLVATGRITLSLDPRDLADNRIFIRRLNATD